MNRKNIQLHRYHNAGFAMLFTILVMSLILTIAIGISNLTFKQTILSSLAKDSQIAFYQADKGIECGMYYDLDPVYFPVGVDLDPKFGNVLYELMCGENILKLDEELTWTNNISYMEITEERQPCVRITINRENTVLSKVTAQGYNMCGESPRKVERALEIQY